jgi:cytochrome c biogenesis protein CcmG/thiol:disulfide interchange protein DsbE
LNNAVRSTLRWVLIVAVVAVLAVSLTGTKGGPKVGGAAPDFSVPMLDGETFSLEEMRGKVVVLDFWATWCRPCRASLPALEQVRDRYKDNPDVFVATVNTDRMPRREEALTRWMTGRKLTLPVLLDDARQTVRQTYRVKAIPTMVVVGRDGRVDSVQIGLPAKTLGGIKDHVIEAVEAALAKPAT